MLADGDETEMVMIRQWRKNDFASATVMETIEEHIARSIKLVDTVNRPRRGLASHLGTMPTH